MADALRRVTAAKALVDAFVSIGLARSATGDAELHDLLAGTDLTRGRTRLLDLPTIETICAKGGTFLEIVRDPNWLGGPAQRLELVLKRLPPSEPQPLIQETMDRLMHLKKLHLAAQPALTLPETALELRRKVMALSRQQ